MEIAEALRGAATECRCSIEIERVFDMSPARFAPSLVGAVEQAATAHGVRYRGMVSGAFHDALFIDRVAPAAMLFVRCRNGVSHNENEFVEPEFCVPGADMLMHTMLEAIAGWD